MKIRFWGTRGSIAKPGKSTVRYGGNTSCVELRTEADTIVIFDCGTGAHELGRELVRQHGKATRGHILISHTHWDHIQGIPFFEPFFEVGGEWDIYGPKGLMQSIRDTLAGQMEYTYFPISVDKFGATIRYHDLVEGAFSIDDVHIVTQYLNHPALTLGYRLRADGATMVYCCDHEPNVAAAGSGELEISGQDRRHVEFLAGADLVIHDSQFTAQEYPQRIGWGHSPAEYVVQVCRAAGVKQVLLTHHDPLRDDDAVDRIVAGLRQRVAGTQPPLDIQAAAEGQVVQVAATAERAPATAAALHEAHATIEAVSLKHPVLLLVSDDKISRLLQEAMKLEGLPDPIVPRTADYLRAVSTDHYSLALIQHDPPAIDGLDIARRMQAGQVDTDTQLPVVLVTADPDPAARNTSVAMDWLIAPFTLSYVRTKLRYWTLRLACRWVPARLPADEARRLEALHNLAVLDTPPEERFDRITRIAAATFDVPIALISLVDKDRQWFKSCVGISVSETPREVAFCAHAVEQHADVVVDDTLLDDRFADNPLVTSGPRIRFYAGAPLLLKNGACLGTLCVVDTRPRHLSAADLVSLHDLRDMVMEQLARTQPGA
jgi:phosphoribosyl 1,2-cyclic phosphodiesterase/DNA-binding response OmpR family regulator